MKPTNHNNDPEQNVRISDLEQKVFVNIMHNRQAYVFFGETPKAQLQIERPYVNYGCYQNPISDEEFKNKIKESFPTARFQIQR